MAILRYKAVLLKSQDACAGTSVDRSPQESENMQKQRRENSSTLRRNPQTPKGPRFPGQVQPDWMKAGDLQEFVDHLQHKNDLCDEVNFELGFLQEQCCLSPVLRRSVLVLMSQDPLCTSGCAVSLIGALTEYDVSPRVIPVTPHLPAPTVSPCSQAQRGAMMLIVLTMVNISQISFTSTAVTSV